MEKSQSNEEIAKSINRLVIPIWIIAIALSINLLVVIFPFAFPKTYVKLFQSTWTESFSEESSISTTEKLKRPEEYLEESKQEEESETPKVNFYEPWIRIISA